MDTAGLRNAFLEAARSRNLQKLKKIATVLQNREGKVAWETLKDANGNTALHIAASSKKADMCKYLIEELNFDVNIVNNTGQTPLHDAVLGLDRHTAKYLLKSGADVTQSDDKGYTPLHYAAEKGSRGLMQLLLSKGADIHVQCEEGTPLHCAAAKGKKEALEFLLQNEAEPNSFSSHLFTPLHLSILAKSLECVELLLKAQADPNVGALGVTPLSVAVAEHEKEVIKCLLDSGAEADLTDVNGLTPLENAALADYRDGVMLLFPKTSPIPYYPDWSVSGIMNHVNSEEAIDQREHKKKEKFQYLKEKGGEAFKQQAYFIAILWYTKAIENDLTDATVLSNRSLCWYHLKEGDNALTDAEACVRLQPDWPKAHYRVGAAWKLLKNYPKAAQSFDRALNLDPKNDEIKKALREVMEAML